VRALGARVSADEAVECGQVVVAGRVPVTVTDILFELSLGATVMELAEELELEIQDVRAALRYAAYLVARERVGHGPIEWNGSLHEKRDEAWRQKLARRQAAIARDGLLNLLEAIVLEAGREARRQQDETSS
jgi:uncharacterized protein (DUF433 family)